MNNRVNEALMGFQSLPFVPLKGYERSWEDAWCLKLMYGLLELLLKITLFRKLENHKWIIGANSNKYLCKFETQYLGITHDS